MSGEVSFDVVSEFDAQELRNALDQVRRETSQRYDFRGATVDLQQGRDELVLVTKVGYVQGRNMAQARERAAAGRPYPEMVEYSEQVWHCISPEFLEEQKVAPWSEMPVWLPAKGEEAAFAGTSNRAALAKGLKITPLKKTVDDTLAWHLARPAEEREKLKAGLAPEKEAEVLAAWKARQK